MMIWGQKRASEAGLALGKKLAVWSRSILFATSLLFSGAAYASDPTLPPPTISQIIDANGVNLSNGDIQYDGPTISVGPLGQGGLSYNGFRNEIGNGDWVSLIKTDGGTKYAVTLLGGTEDFVLSGGVFSSSHNGGGTLALSGGVYTYTRRDGAVALFNSASLMCTDWCTVGVIDNVVFASGEKYVFTLRMRNDFVGISSINSNLGYQIKVNYVCASPSTAYCYIQHSQVIAINNAVDYCDPTGNACTGMSRSWPTLSFSYPVTSTEVITDAEGHGTTVAFSSMVVGDRTQVTRSLIRPSGRHIDYVTYQCESCDPGYIEVNDGSDAVHPWKYLIEPDPDADIIRTTVTDPLGHVRNVVSNYTTGFPVTDTVDPTGLNLITTYTPGVGAPTRITFPEGNYINYLYDTRGNVTETRKVAKPSSGIADIVSTAVYPSCTTSNYRICNKPTSITDPNGNTTDYTYDAAHGGILTATAPAVIGGRPEVRSTYQAIYAYYKNGAGSIVAAGAPIYRLMQTSKCMSGTAAGPQWGSVTWGAFNWTSGSCIGTALESVTSNTYQVGSTSSASNVALLSVTNRAGDSSVSATNSQTYDDYGNVATMTGPGSGSTSAYFYDMTRQVTGSIAPAPDDTGSGNNSAVKTTYDVDGRVAEVEQGTTTSESSMSSFVSLAQKTLDYQNTYFAPLTLEIHYMGGTSHPVSSVQKSYDTARNPECTAVRENVSAFSSLPAACTLSTTGSFGQDQISKNSYDAANRLLTVQTGYDTSSPVTAVTNAYTSNSQVDYVEDGSGNRSDYTYDGQDRLVQLNYPSKTTPHIASSSDYEQYGYDLNGNRTSLRPRSGSSDTIAYGYDALNRLTLKDVPGSAGDVYYGYNLTGNLLYAHYGSVGGSGIDYVWDALGRKATETSYGRTVASQYDAAGNRTHLIYPDSTDMEYTYDIVNRMKQLKSGSSVLAQYSYDDLGREAGISRPNATSTSFSYGTTSQDWTLTQAMASSSQTVTFAMTFTPGGQMAGRSISNSTYAYSVGSSTLSYTANGLNQYSAVNSATPTYDDRGNLTNDGARTLSYDGENRLTGVSGSPALGVAYDPAGRMQQTSYSSTRQYLYDGASLIAEYDASGNLLRRYVPGQGADETLVWYEGSGLATPNWLHTDQQGSVIATSDAAGAATTHVYSPTGEQSGSWSGEAAPIFRYTGQAALPVAQLYYYKARVYDATLGRFLQTDPIGYDGGMNLYAYADNDPVNQIDPSGTDACPAGMPINTECVTSVGFRTGGGGGGGGAVVPATSATDSPPRKIILPPTRGTNSKPYESNGYIGVACLIEAGRKNPAVLADTAGLFAGFVPGGGAVFVGGQLALATGSALYGASHPSQSPTSNAFGVATFAAGYNTTALSLVSRAEAPTLARFIPVAGTLISGASLVNDIFSKGGFNDAYNACVARRSQ